MKLSTAQKVLAVVLGSAVAVAFVVGAFVAPAANAQSASYVFTRTLKLGSTGADVMQLQKVLNASVDTQVAAVGAGSPGMESTYFGAKTKVAVIKFQEKYAAQILTPVGLTKGTGTVGASTRNLLNNTQSTGNVPPVVTNGPVSVSLANSVSYGAIVSPSATAQLASFTFTGNGTVSNVWLKRTGVSSDNTLTNVYLYDGATRLTDAASVSSGNISFNNPSGLFMVSGSRTVTVRADVATGQGGATIGVALASYTVVGGNAVTTNIAGNIQNVASNITAATVSVNTNTVNAQSVNAGASNLTAWSAPINVGQRAVYLQAVSFKFIGSAPVNAIANTQLLVDGAVVSTASGIDSNSQLTFNLSSAPLTLNTGSHTLAVQTNVVAGAYRNFQLSLQNSGDLMVADSQLQGVNVAPVSNGGSTFSSNSGGLITINSGSVVVQLDPAFNPTTVVGGAANVPIAQFKFTSYGEDVKVNSLSVLPKINGAAASFNNVAVYVNGGQVGSTLNDATTTLVFGTNNLFTIPAGQTVIVTIKADTISAQNTNYSTGSLTVDLPGVSTNAQGVQSSSIVGVPSATVSSYSITIGTGAATIGKNTALSNYTVAPNTNNVKIGSYVIQASSAEGLRVNSVVVTLGGSITPSTGILNLVISTPVGRSNTITNTQAINNFNISNFTIPMNGTAIVDVYADVNTAGTASSSIAVTAQGVVSNVTVTGSATGQTVTVGTGSLSTPVLESSSPVSQFIVGGVNNFPVATYNFVSTTTPAVINELYFNVTGPVSEISVNGVKGNVSGTSASVKGLNLQVPSGYSGVDVNVIPSFNVVDGNTVTSGLVSTTTLTGYQVKIGDVTTTNTSLTVNANAMKVVAGLPTLSIASPNGIVLGSSAALTEVADVSAKVDANGGTVRIKTLPLTLNTSAYSNVSASASTSPTVEVRVGGVAVPGVTFSDMDAIGTSASKSITVTFPGVGYAVNPGQTVTFEVMATANSTGTPSAGDASVSTKLGTAASFGWVDVGGNNAAQTGSFLLSSQYPTGSATIRN